MLRLVIKTLPLKKRKAIEQGNKAAEGQLLLELREEKEIYREKLDQVKRTTELTKLLENIAEQEQIRSEITEEMLLTEQPIVDQIKKSHAAASHIGSSSRCEDFTMRRKRGKAKSQVRQKRAELGRVVAKKRATIEKLHSKLNIIISHENRIQRYDNVFSSDAVVIPNRKTPDNTGATNADTLKLPKIKPGSNTNTLKAGQNSATERRGSLNKTSIPVPNSSQQKLNKWREWARQSKKARSQASKGEQSTTGDTSDINKKRGMKRKKSSFPAIKDLLIRMEFNLDKLEKYTSSSLTEKADKMKDELRSMEEVLTRKLKSIKEKQQQDVQVQRMRVKYKELQGRNYQDAKAKIKEVRNDQQTMVDKLEQERERLRKLRYEQLQMKLRRMRIEQEIFGYVSNSRFTQRGFLYF